MPAQLHLRTTPSEFLLNEHFMLSLPGSDSNITSPFSGSDSGYGSMPVETCQTASSTGHWEYNSFERDFPNGSSEGLAQINLSNDPRVQNAQYVTADEVRRIQEADDFDWGVDIHWVPDVQSSLTLQAAPISRNGEVRLQPSTISPDMLALLPTAQAQLGNTTSYSDRMRGPITAPGYQNGESSQASAGDGQQDDGGQDDNVDLDFVCCRCLAQGHGQYDCPYRG